MIKGYRKLKVGETIKEGDCFLERTGMVRAVFSVGMKRVKDIQCFRPTKKHEKKYSYQKRLPIHDQIVGIMAEQYSRSNPCMAYYYDQVAKEVVKFVQNNYRRRKKG